MRYCTRCGAKLQPDQHFCTECGMHVDKETASPASAGAPPERGERHTAPPEEAVMPHAPTVAPVEQTTVAPRVAGDNGTGSPIGSPISGGPLPGGATMPEPALPNKSKAAAAKPDAAKAPLIALGIVAAFALGFGATYLIASRGILGGETAQREAPAQGDAAAGTNADKADEAPGTKNGTEEQKEDASDVKAKASLADYSWSELGKIAQKMYGAGSRKAALDVAATYHLANGTTPSSATKSVRLSDGTEVKLRLVGLMHDERADGKGAAAMSFVATNVTYRSRMAPNTTTDGGWEASELRAWMNGELRKKLPSDLSDVVIPVKKASNNVGKARSGECVSQTTDYLWAPSIVELTGPLSWTYDSDPSNSAFYNSVFNAEGDQYAYFSQAGVRSSDANGCLAFGEDWWMRSTAASSGRGRFVDASGNPSSFGNSNDAHGVVVGLCI